MTRIAHAVRIRHGGKSERRDGRNALTMGTLDSLMVLISSAMPLRSPAPIPSTSSMMMTLLRTGGAPFPPFPPSKLSTWEPVTSPSARPRAFFPRESEALSSRTSRPDSAATSVAVVVFPSRGGARTRASG